MLLQQGERARVRGGHNRAEVGAVPPLTPALSPRRQSLRNVGEARERESPVPQRLDHLEAHGEIVEQAEQLGHFRAVACDLHEPWPIASGSASSRRMTRLSVVRSSVTVQSELRRVAAGKIGQRAVLQGEGIALAGIGELPVDDDGLPSAFSPLRRTPRKSKNRSSDRPRTMSPPAREGTAAADLPWRSSCAPSR